MLSLLGEFEGDQLFQRNITYADVGPNGDRGPDGGIKVVKEEKDRDDGSSTTGDDKSQSDSLSTPGGGGGPGGPGGHGAPPPSKRSRSATGFTEQ